MVPTKTLRPPFYILNVRSLKHIVMNDQLFMNHESSMIESYKLERCIIRCKACDFSKNVRSALLSFKPLKLAKFLLQQ